MDSTWRRQKGAVNVDADGLRFSESVARLVSTNRAAADLNTVQSNVTSRIRALELVQGTTLFRRHARGVSVTSASQRLLPYAARVHDLLAEARRVVRDDGTPVADRFT
jgi:DNA-binding transcriptional LysR family regulator